MQALSDLVLYRIGLYMLEINFMSESKMHTAFYFTGAGGSNMMPFWTIAGHRGLR